MNKTLIVMRHEFMTMVSKPSFWIGLIGVPLIMGITMGISLLGGAAATAATISNKQNQTVIQGYVDHSGIIKTLPADSKLHSYPDEQAALADLNAGKINGYFVVAANYIATGDVTYVSPEFTPINSPTGNFDRVLKLNLAGGNQDELARTETTVNIQNEQALAPVQSKGGSGLPFPLLPMFAGIMFMIVMVTASSYLMHTVSTEKESRVMEVLMSSVTPTQMLAGKVMGLGLVGFIQMALWLISSVSALNTIPAAASLGSISAGSIIVAIVYFIFGYFTYAALMAGLGAMMPGTREAAQYTFFVILPLLIPMYLVTALVLEPNGPLAVILSLIPFTSPVVMVMRVTATDVPFFQVLAGAVILALTSVAVVNLVARLFRAQMLLSGAKPSLKEIVAALRS
ncbi:MAG: ABC transporter permease [Chloroflexi bacterium]|nr:ABC transporter permease [Chloroflexota bacterium]MCL5274443.1 ABC transporter permease [Chloroflexota bacterium]